MSAVGGVGDLRGQLADSALKALTQFHGEDWTGEHRKDAERVAAAVVESEPIRALRADADEARPLRVAAQAVVDHATLINNVPNHNGQRAVYAHLIDRLAAALGGTDMIGAAVARVEGLGVPTPNDQETP